MIGIDGFSAIVISDLVSLQRRHVLALGGAAMLSAAFNTTARAQEGASADAKAGQSSTAKDYDERPDTTTTYMPDETYGTEQRPMDLREQLGLSWRAPRLMYDDGWEISEEFFDRADRLSQSKESGFVGGANQTLMSPEGSPLETAFRNMLSNAPEASGTSAENTRRLDSSVDSVELSLQSKIYRAFEAVEWQRLGSATLDLAVDITADYTEGHVLDRVAGALGTQAMNNWFNGLGWVLKVVSPEMINNGQREELSYVDRMSPAERRDFYQDVFLRRVHLPATMPPNGPTLRAP